VYGDYLTTGCTRLVFLIHFVGDAIWNRNNLLYVILIVLTLGMLNRCRLCRTRSWILKSNASSASLMTALLSAERTALGIVLKMTRLDNNRGQNPFPRGQNQYRGHMYGPIQTKFGIDLRNTNGKVLDILKVTPRGATTVGQHPYRGDIYGQIQTKCGTINLFVHVCKNAHMFLSFSSPRRLQLCVCRCN
jgi:hypothetical protein